LIARAWRRRTAWLRQQSCPLPSWRCRRAHDRACAALHRAEALPGSASADWPRDWQTSPWTNDCHAWPR
jgi:hypothetical protein